MRLCILFGFVLLASCAGSSSEERKNGYSDLPKNTEDSLFQEVMDLHDQAMAKISKMKGSREQLEARIDSLKKVKSTGKESLTKKYAEISNDLKLADDKMSNWMHEFSIDTLQDDSKRRIAYLESEKSKVSAVRDNILSALSKADSVLNKESH
jgi:hypothetical protein